MMKAEKNYGFWGGSVSFSGIGGFREKMLSELLEDGVRVKNVTFSGGILRGAASPLDYYKIAKTARKNGVRIKSEKRSGLYFLLSRYKNRAGLYVGLIIFVIWLSFYQTRVADIEIIGEANRAQVMNILEECGIREGSAKAGMNLSKAEQRIMLEVENCAWADVSCEGFRVRVEIQKGVEKPEIEGKEPRNLVAARPALIVSKTVRRGASAADVGSGVNTGDLLVSGTVFDGTGKILYVHSEGEIIGEFYETREFFVPYKEIKKLAEGEKISYNSLLLGDDEYPLYFGAPSVENAVYDEETRLVFGANSLLKLKVGTFTKYVEREISRSPEACVNELQKLKNDYEENFFSGYEIAAAEEKFFPEGGGIRLIVDYTLRGDIAKAAEIEIVDETVDS